MASADDFANRDVIESLVIELHKGTISPQDRERLNSLLLGSREGRRLFLQYAHIEAGLHWIYAARQQVATVIDDATANEIRPTAGIAQQQLRFADDPLFMQVMHACAKNELHSQEWLQLYPRLVAVIDLCIPSSSSARDPLRDVIYKLLSVYSPEMSAEAFWAAVSKATRDVLKSEAASGKDTAPSVDALLLRAFAPSRGESIFDAVAIFEILDDCIPHRLPADTLRVLSLRYINGLPADRIAAHLNRSAQHIQAQLGKVRVHLVSKCLAAAGFDVKKINARALFLWSSIFDLPVHGSRMGLVSTRQASDLDVDATQLLLLAIVHDYLRRQLSATRLLEEVRLQKDRSYLLAIEQSIRDIEALGTTRHEVTKRPANRQRTLRLAAFLGIAACLLIAIGTAILSGMPKSDFAFPPSKDLAKSRESSPPVPSAHSAAREASPPVMPVVASISEAIGISAADRDRLAIGSELRVQDIVAFEQGILELSTTSGCNLVLEGPVDALMADRNRILLRRGKLAALNDGGESLIVDSPKSSIVDVGTEFGVGVGKLGETTVAVYEGEVRLEPHNASHPQKANTSLELEAGWETRIAASAELPSEATRLLHDREFIRSDEVQVRKEAKRGNPGSLAKLRYFALLRTEGLLCYQGFHGASGGDYSIGFRSPAIRCEGTTNLGPDVLDIASRFGESHSLGAGKDASCYLDIDVGPQSRLARAGLVGEDGLIGNVPGELWLCWRTKASGPPGTTFSWGGLSLMFGDRRSEDEPLFVGKAAPLAHYGFHVYPGAGEPRELVRTLDNDSTAPGDQPHLPDLEEHLWMVRLRMSGRTTEVAVWCDAHPEKVAIPSPEAQQTIQDFRFDRIRLEAHPDGAQGAWFFDDVIIASSSDAMAETLRFVSQDVSQLVH